MKRQVGVVVCENKKCTRLFTQKYLKQRYCSRSCSNEGGKRVYSLERNKKISDAKKLHYSDSCGCAGCRGRRGEFHGKNNGMYGKHYKKPPGAHDGCKNPNYGNGDKVRGNKNPMYQNGYKLLGSKNGRWLGGVSFEPYALGWTSTFKEQIRYRDGYKCRCCGMPEIENGRKLSVHHIDYNKKNITVTNLISLCNSCHSKTNANRLIWQKEFEKRIQHV